MLNHFIKYSILYRIRSDHNIDKTNEILKLWLNSIEDAYHSVNASLLDGDDFFPDENETIFHWSDYRIDHVNRLQESALNNARDISADYIFVSENL